MVRSRRLKEHHIISELPEDSDNILYPSWIDTFYSSRPNELEGMNLYGFLAWHGMVKKRPSDRATFHKMLGHFLKKRQVPYLIIKEKNSYNHFRCNPELERENIFTRLFCFSSHGETRVLSLETSLHTLKYLTLVRIHYQIDL